MIQAANSNVGHSGGPPLDDPAIDDEEGQALRSFLAGYLGEDADPADLADLARMIETKRPAVVLRATLDRVGLVPATGVPLGDDDDLAGWCDLIILDAVLDPGGFGIFRGRGGLNHMVVALSQLRATIDDSGYIGPAQAIADANAKMAASQEKANVAITETERRLGTATTGLERFLRGNDQVYAAQQKVAAGTALLQRAADQYIATGGKQGISAAEHARQLELLNQRYAPIVQGSLAAAATITTLANAARGTGQDLEKLAESHDRVSGSSGRMREGMVLVHEFLSGNYRRAVGSATIELQNFGLMQSSLSVALNPFVLAGVATVGVLTLLELNYEANEKQARSLNTAFGVLGTGSAGLTANLQTVARQLRDTGASSADATASVLEIARNPRLNPNAAASIATAGQNLGAFQGTDAVQGIKTYIGAITGGIDATMKLGFSLNAFTADEAVSIQEMARHGDTAGALARAIDDIDWRLSDVAKKSLSDAKNATGELSQEWHRLLDGLSETEWFGSLHTGFVQLIRDVGDFVKAGEISSPNSVLPRLFPGLAPFMVRAAPRLSAETAAQDEQDRLDSLRNAQAGGRWGNAPGDSATRLISGGASLSDLMNSLWQTESGNRQVDRAGNTIISPKGAIGVGQIMPATAVGLGGNPYDETQNRAMSTGLMQALISKYNGDVTLALEAYNWGEGNVDKYLAGYKSMPSSVAHYAGTVMSGAGLPNMDVAPVAAVPQLASDTQKDAAQKLVLSEQTDRIKLQSQAYGLFGQSLIETQARIQATTEAEAKHLEGAQKGAFITNAVTEAVAKHNDALAKAATIQHLTTEGVLASALAYGENEVAGLEAAALATAKLAVTQGTANDVAQKQREILAANAATAIDAAAKRNTAELPSIAAQQRLADAAAIGTAALHDQEVVNTALAATQGMVNAAQATHNLTTIAAAQAERDKALAIAKTIDLEKQRQAQNTFTGQLSFDRAQLGRDAGEQQIYSTLRGVPGAIGNDGTLTAYGQQSAATMRLTSALSDAKSEALAFGDTLVSGLMRGAKLSDTLSSAFQQLAGKLANKAFDALLSPVFSPSAGSGLFSFLGISGSIFGSAASGASVGVGKAHTGGIVGSGDIARMMVSPHLFYDAPRFHGGGIVGDEYPIVAKRDEGIFTPAQMKALGSRSGAPPSQTVNITIGDIGNGMSRQEIMTSVHRTVGGAMRESNRQLEKSFNAMAANARDRTG